MSFPAVGSGTATFSDFRGEQKELPRSTISHRRHVPMVKPITIAHAFPADAPHSSDREHSQLLLPRLNLVPSVDVRTQSPGTRAPPAY